MKKILPLVSLFALLISGCSTGNISNKYEFITPAYIIESDIGYLKVHTYKYQEQVYSDDIPRMVNKGYSIYSLAGDHITNVDKTYGEPKTVKLKEGTYIVVAEMSKDIIHSFQINIKKGKISEIDSSMIVNLSSTN